MNELLSPQLSYRWRIRILNDSMTTDIRNSVTCQALSVKIDYLNKKITLVIRQDSVTHLIHEAVMQMTHSHNKIIVESLANNQAGSGFAWALLFNAIVVDHDFILDYGATDKPVNHTLVLTFKDMPKILNINDEKVSA